MKQIIALILSISIASCNGPNEQIQVVNNDKLTQTQIDSILEDYNFQYSKAIFIDSLEKVIFPLSTQNKRSKARLSSSLYNADDHPNYWNFIFHDISTATTTVLTTKKTQFSSYSTNFKKVGPILKKSVLYKAGDTDYNKDQKLTHKDPQQLFISDHNGHGFKRLSPINEELVEYHIVEHTDKLIFKTYRDTNRDLEFNKEDDQVWYMLDLSADIPPLEIFDKQKRTELETLYFNQWLVKKEKAQD